MTKSKTRSGIPPRTSSSGSSPVRQAVLLPLEVVSEGGESGHFAVRDAAAGLLHQLQGVAVQRAGDLQTEELLHLAQLLPQWADAPSDGGAGLLFQVEELLQVALREGEDVSVTSIDVKSPSQRNFWSLQIKLGTSSYVPLRNVHPAQ